MRRRISSALRRLAALAVAALSMGGLAQGGAAATTATALAIHPAFSDAQFLRGGLTPPSEADCNANGRRCFAPAAMRNSYNLGPLYAQGLNGAGQTIAIVDSWGSETIASDLNNFDTQFGLQHLCGEANYACAAGDPTFRILSVQGSPDPKAPPPTAKDPGQENKNLWSLEVSLDVEWAHAIAPQANILLVTVPTAETLGVQGFPLMMNAEQYVVDHGLASVISQSFASAEDAFGSSQSLLELHKTYVSAAAHGVTVLGSSGDFGTANVRKTPVGQGGSLIAEPTVEWPASDPLVTGVGGTYLCTDGATGTFVDSTRPSGRCPAFPGQREVGWTFSGGGFSHVFSRPSYQDTLPAGSTTIGAMRGVPDVAFQASAGTGVLIYDTAPGTGGSDVGNDGWWVIGGTSASCPQWAGIVAIADQQNGGPLGFLNPALYQIASSPSRYAADFFDVTTGNNTTDPTVAGYPATTGWDPVTGLGTPNAANLVPDLVSAAKATP